MGLSTEPALSPTASGRQPRLPTPARRVLRSATTLRRLALASVVANVVIVVTGGAVRLTDSGLGCPTWPNCDAGRLTPSRATSFHVYVEFGNRTLTFVLVIVAIATWLTAMAQRRERRLATMAVLGIPAQAVLGGLTVLTHLNPWLVALHFLLSSALIATTFVLWWRVRPDDAVPPAAVRTRLLARLVTAAAAVTIVVGTVVTGSGPHAGDLTSGRVRRTGLDPGSMAQLHADLVMVLVGLTLGLLVFVHAVSVAPAVRRAAWTLAAVLAAQAGIGYAQYFLHLPELLVGFHMLGACLVWLAALQVLLLAEPKARRAVVTTPG